MAGVQRRFRVRYYQSTFGGRQFMRSLLITAIGLALTLGTIAQGPPKYAVDITKAPAAADAPASVIRVFIGRLTGVDATSIRGLLTQALFESKKVVITENQSNASLILQGRVLRRQIPVRSTAPGGQKRRARKTRAADTTNPTVVQDLEALKQNGKVINLDADSTSTSEAMSGVEMPTPSAYLNGGEEDLNPYQFRLYLQLVSPSGDLIWMSGEGVQAPPYSSASDAVSATVQPMLSAIASLPKSNPTSQP